jgi:hypothetical protein
LRISVIEHNRLMVLRDICAIMAPAIRRCVITAEPLIKSQMTIRESLCRANHCTTAPCATVIAPTEVLIATAAVFNSRASSRARHLLRKLRLDFEAHPKQNCKCVMLKHVT